MPPIPTTNFTVTLIGDGCGFELSEGAVYSIGNQIVDAVIDEEDEDAPCGAVTILINGEEVPTVVCDADVITVTAETEDCNCSQQSVSCEESVPTMFLRSKIGPDGKMKFWLSNNPKLKQLKREKIRDNLKIKLAVKNQKKRQNLAEQPPQ